MLKISSTVTLLFLTLFAFAQRPDGGGASPKMNIGKLTGKIMEESGGAKKPIPFTSVTVLRAMGQKDSLIGGALTEENGDFTIPGLPFGPLKVKISALGFKEMVKMVKISPPDNVEQDLGNLVLVPDAKVLDGVTITAEKASTQLSLEKRVFNVDKSITATGGTAEDVMKNVPSVTVDADGGVKLRDNTPTIYVDGKPTLMALTQIPADQIESVEVITNPSAKYEASTTGGILNIVLKKNRKPGYNGIVGLGVGSGGRYNGMFSLNAHQDKWTLNSFFNFNAEDKASTGYVNRFIVGADGSHIPYFNQNTDVNFNTNFKLARVGVDYALNNRNTLSLYGTAVSGKFNIDLNQKYYYSGVSADSLTTGVRTQQPLNSFNNYNFEGTWKKTFPKKDESLTTTASFSFGNGSNAAMWTTTGYNASGQALSDYPQYVNITGGNTNRQGIFQMDYSNPLNDSTKIEMGVRSYWKQTDQQYFYAPYIHDQTPSALDTSLSQNALINENVNAAYFTYSSRWANNWNYQLGLRFEESYLNGASRFQNVGDYGYTFPNSSKNILNSFFPSFFVSKKVDESTEIGFNASRKIGRPGFFQLMPGVRGSDKQNITIGNPALQPEFTNKAEINYNKIFGNNSWLSTVYASLEDNTIKPFTIPSATDPSVLVTTFVNGQNEIIYGIDNTLKLGFGKNFEVTANANIFNFSLKVDTFQKSFLTGNAKLGLTYRFPGNITAQINSGYRGKRPQAQGYNEANAYMDFAVKKTFFHGAANITFNINDVFDSRTDISVYDQPTYFQETMRRRDTRFYKLSIQIPFGNPDASMFKKKDKKGPEQPAMDDNGQ